MTRVLPPLLGYNNNVRYLGRTFHIQTEDSGTKYARIMTHLFIDGGHIVKTTRTEYGPVVGQPDMAETVRRMMKDQHKNMFLSLRAGDFDALIERIDKGGAPTPPAETTISQVPRLRTGSLPSLSFGPGEEAKTTPGMSTLIIESKVAPEFTMETPAVTHHESPASAELADDSRPNPKRGSTRMRKGKSVAPEAAPSGRHPSARQLAAADVVVSGGSSRSPSVKMKLPISGEYGAVAHYPAGTGATGSHGDPSDMSDRSGSDREADARLSSASLIAAAEGTRPSERPQRGVPARPATTTVEAIDPRSQNIFGAATAGRQTLDDVILSFLEDEEK